MNKGGLTEADKYSIVIERERGVKPATLAKKYGCDISTVYRTVASPRYKNFANDLKKEFLQSMSDYLKSKNEEVQVLIDKMLRLIDDKADSAQFRDLIGGVKVLAEVFTDKDVSTAFDGQIIVNVEAEDASEANDAGSA